jgi:hypothetical protein
LEVASDGSVAEARMSFGLRVGGDLLEWGDEVRVVEMEAIPLFSNIQSLLKMSSISEQRPAGFYSNKFKPKRQISDEKKVLMT